MAAQHRRGPGGAPLTSMITLVLAAFASLFLPAAFSCASAALAFLASAAATSSTCGLRVVGSGFGV